MENLGHGRVHEQQHWPNQKSPVLQRIWRSNLFWVALEITILGNDSIVNTNHESIKTCVRWRGHHSNILSAGFGKNVRRNAVRKPAGSLLPSLTNNRARAKLRCRYHSSFQAARKWISCILIYKIKLNVVFWLALACVRQVPLTSLLENVGIIHKLVSK